MNSTVITGIVGLIWLIGAALTYSRADREGRNGSAWGLAALIGGPLAWIAYGITTNRDPLGEHTPIGTPDFVPAQALHIGYSKAGTRAETDITIHAERDFSDPYVERLIAKGSLRDAKDAVQSLIVTAKEAHDLPMIASYEVYAQRIRHLELEKVRHDKPTPIAGPPMDYVDNTGMLLHGEHAAESAEGTMLI